MSNTAIEKRDTPTLDIPDRADSTTASNTVFTPLVDVIETGDAFIFQADLPGVKAGDVDVTFEKNVLTIQAKAQPRQAADQAYVWREYGVGTFYRQFTLDTPIDVNQIKAQFKDGVLDLHVPKTESARTRKIELKGR